jgi:hypothetical protein
MKAVVRSESYVIAKLRKPIHDCFAVIDDGREITAIVDHSRFQERDALEFARDWKAITIDTALTFEVVGFLAFVSDALAQIGVSVFVVSAYSTDHLLVKERDLNKALSKLRAAGFDIFMA